MKNQIYNVKNYGAKTDGNDDSAAIQKAIDNCAANGGGIVYLPAGMYIIRKTINKKAKVSLTGDGMASTCLSWMGEENNAIISTSNESLHGVKIEDISFHNGGKGKNIIGIIGGSTLKNYNSAIGTFKNLTFMGLYTGIAGNAEPDGVGIFDCYFENIFCYGCELGLHLYGSGNTIVHPRFANCKSALCLDYLNDESFDGIHVIGGIFAQNIKDILIPDQRGLRPCNFIGTWFEDSKEGIITVSNKNTRIMNMTFRDCMLNSKVDVQKFFLFDARNVKGVITLDNCTIVDYRGLMAPINRESVFEIRNLQVIDNSDSYIIASSTKGIAKLIGDGKKADFYVKHNMKLPINNVDITPASADMAKGGYYITYDDIYIKINFIKAPEKDSKLNFYWEVKV